MGFDKKSTESKARGANQHFEILIAVIQEAEGMRKQNVGTMALPCRRERTSLFPILLQK